MAACSSIEESKLKHKYKVQLINTLVPYNTSIQIQDLTAHYIHTHTHHPNYTTIISQRKAKWRTAHFIR